MRHIARAPLDIKDPFRGTPQVKLNWKGIYLVLIHAIEYWAAAIRHDKATEVTNPLNDCPSVVSGGVICVLAVPNIEPWQGARLNALGSPISLISLVATGYVPYAPISTHIDDAQLFGIPRIEGHIGMHESPCFLARHFDQRVRIEAGSATFDGVRGPVMRIYASRNRVSVVLRSENYSRVGETSRHPCRFFFNGLAEADLPDWSTTERPLSIFRVHN